MFGVTGLKGSWAKFVRPPKGVPNADNDRYGMLFTSAEMEAVRDLRDSLIRRNLITDMSVHLNPEHTTLVFKDTRRPDNVFFHMQKIRENNGAPEYRVGPGKIGLHLETIDFDVAMSALERICRKKALADKPAHIFLAYQQS